MRFLDWVHMNNKAKSTTLKQVTKHDLTPRLRFPEFRDAGEWGKKKISQISENVTTGGTPNTLEKEYWGGSIRWMNSGELNSKKVHEVQGRITVEGLRNSSTKTIPRKCVLIGLAGQGKTRGTVAMNMVELCVNQSIAAIYPSDEKFYSDFLYHQLDNRYDELRRLSAGGEGRGGLNLKIIRSLDIPLPRLEEQQKIANCLSSIDELISAEAKKLDALKTHKKGLMQQLFPAEGETLPKLRFPEFREAGEWEEKTLSELGELVSGLTYSPDDVRDNGLLVLRSSNVQNGMIVLDDNVYVRTDIKGANPSKPNDILICVRNGSKSLIGKNAVIPEGMPLCTHGAFMTVFRSKSAKFIIQLFQTDAYDKQVSADLGATINSINGNHLKKYKFFVPEPDEQQKIANGLATFDDLITAQTQQLAALKSHKKGLMQQLFPNPELSSL